MTDSFYDSGAGVPYEGYLINDDGSYQHLGGVEFPDRVLVEIDDEGEETRTPAPIVATDTSASRIDVSTLLAEDDPKVAKALAPRKEVEEV